MQLALQITTIVFSILIIAAITFQVKGMAGAGVFGSGYSTFRTRRGFEKTLFRATIFLMAIFVVIALVAARDKAGHGFNPF